MLLRKLGSVSDPWVKQLGVCKVCRRYNTPSDAGPPLPALARSALALTMPLLTPHAFPNAT